MPIEPAPNEPVPSDPTAPSDPPQPDSLRTDSQQSEPALPDASENAVLIGQNDAVITDPSQLRPAQVVMGLAATHQLNTMADETIAGDGAGAALSEKDFAHRSSGGLVPPKLSDSAPGAASPSAGQSLATASLQSAMALNEEGSAFDSTRMLVPPSQALATTRDVSAVAADDEAERGAKGVGVIQSSNKNTLSRGTEQDGTAGMVTSVLAPPTTTLPATAPGNTVGSVAQSPPVHPVSSSGISPGPMPFGTALRHPATTVARVDVSASISDFEHRVDRALHAAMSKLRPAIEQQIASQIQQFWTEVSLRQRYQ